MVHMNKILKKKKKFLVNLDYIFSQYIEILTQNDMSNALK